MAIVRCPQCSTELDVPADLLGRKVKCSNCQNVIDTSAVAPVASAPPTAPPDEFERPRRRREREYDDDYDDDLDDRRRIRRDGAPHRGGLILTLGILSILGMCCPIGGWITGGFAISMANNDMPRMDDGAMDPEGRGLTNAGRICGVIGIIVSTLSAIGGVIINLSQMRH